jgi:transposase
MVAMRKFLADEQGAMIALLLPPAKLGSKGGRPSAPNRKFWRAFCGYCAWGRGGKTYPSIIPVRLLVGIA